MPPPFGPFAGAGRPRGPPPFVVQILRAPLTLNNIIALAITMSVRRSLKAEALDAGRKPCMMTSDAAFSFLALIFAMSIGHNVLSVMRFHRIRREVFGESMCAARRRWKQRGEIVLDEEEMKARMEKFREMGKRLPSIFISTADLFLAMVFLGLFIWTTLLAKKWGKVELSVAYSSIGALVACVFNLIIGINGVKFWVRQHKKQQESKLEEATNEHVADVKEKLLSN
ncbi:hypothetical protein H2198_006355 [Neophaeococcomyces mojaviensis]|uniref:Uncharacterized protein n=1 Tax=Neophaeococcomyces mojaviensis TaxID=3383035 RepID=A0ACC3A302_9EURO|nr:hypothetical protein H2198_006355 [Knufia sp. JES_112]